MDGMLSGGWGKVHVGRGGDLMVSSLAETAGASYSFKTVAGVVRGLVNEGGAGRGFSARRAISSRTLAGRGRARQFLSSFHTGNRDGMKIGMASFQRDLVALGCNFTPTAAYDLHRQ